MTAADLVLHGARLLTLAPLKDERPRVGPAAGDVGAVMDGFVAARDGAIVATGHGAALEALERVEDAVDVAVTYLAAHALPAPYTDDRKRFIRDATNAIAAIVDGSLAEAVDAFVEKGVFDVDDVRPLFSAAKKAGLAVTMHADQLNDVGASAFAARTRARSADHVANASAEGVRALARAEVPAVLLPGSAFFVGYAPPDARRFMSARVPIALASDHNPGTSPLEGMPTAIALGVTLCGLTPHEAIVAATINAAHALGRGGRVGALVAGRRADILVLDTDDERELAYRMGAPLIAEVYASGRRVA